MTHAEQTTNPIRPTGSHSSKHPSMLCCPSALPSTPRLRTRSVPWQYLFIVVCVPIHLTSSFTEGDTDLLRDESSEIDVVGPTLPVLKSLLTPGATYKVTEFFQRVVHGLLSSCLLNIDEMRSVHVILQDLRPILTPRSEGGKARFRPTKSRTTSWQQSLS